MRTWLRRMRGAIGMGFVWGAAWALVGSAPHWLFGFNTDAPFPLIFGVLGCIAGFIFSGLVVVTERRRSFDQISLPRFAVWGAIGGLFLSGIFTKCIARLARCARDRPDIRTCQRDLRLRFARLGQAGTEASTVRRGRENG